MNPNKTMLKFHESVAQGARDLLQIILQNQKFKHFIINAKLTNLGVRGEMKADIKSKEDVKTWIETLEETTNTTYRVNYTKPSVGVWILYKLGVKCHHNTGGKKLNSDVNRSCKNTKCPSRLTFTVNAIPKKIFKRNNNVDPELPTVIDFYYEHNHPINSADVLRFRPVDPQVEDKILNLYQKGHSPSSALQTLKIDLESEHPSDYETLLADRKFCPDLSYCHRLFYKKFKNKFGPVNVLDSREFLQEKVKEYNAQCNMTCAKMTEASDDFVLAICTPLMHRIHQSVPQSAEIMFVDASGAIRDKDKDKDKEKLAKVKGKDKDSGHRMFLLSTYNTTGSLPLGVIITVSESPDIIYKGLELYKSLLPEGGTHFYGRGEIGPAVIMTDDTLAERVALNMAWRYATLLLCTFHVLQAMWRWLMKSQNGIKKEDRTMLFQTFKTVVYSHTEMKCQDNFNKLKYIAKDYSQYINYISSMWDRRSEWALCYRSAPTLLIRENSTVNTVENVTKILKDEIFERVKSFNLAQIADFIFSRFEAYYSRKLLDVAYDRATQKKLEFRNPYWKSPSDIVLKAIREQNGVYCVPSESDPENPHTVDVDLVCCTCSVGRNGVFCKHQYWVSLIINKTSQQKSLEFRKHSFFLAKGEEANDMWLLHSSFPPTTSTGPKTESWDDTLPELPDPDNTGDEELEIPEETLEDVWSDGLGVLKEKVPPGNHEKLVAAVKQFVENLRSMSRTSVIATALNNFGKGSKEVLLKTPPRKEPVVPKTTRTSLRTKLPRATTKRKVIEETPGPNTTKKRKKKTEKSNKRSNTNYLDPSQFLELELESKNGMRQRKIIEMPEPEEVLEDIVDEPVMEPPSLRSVQAVQVMDSHAGINVQVETHETYPKNIIDPISLEKPVMDLLESNIEAKSYQDLVVDTDLSRKPYLDLMSEQEMPRKPYLDLVEAEIGHKLYHEMSVESEMIRKPYQDIILQSDVGIKQNQQYNVVSDMIHKPYHTIMQPEMDHRSNILPDPITNAQHNVIMNSYYKNEAQAVYTLPTDRERAIS